ncbi:hypothetical protein [Actinoplanes sp. G11-F43]|uniref:hypothetical protein n=1 Tax=Actinoplanes sp. G11-F43 TaxID=3424130 RepID=UPI003D328E5E
MRQVYAHQATLVLTPGTDPGAPGAAITAALRGHREHGPPCPPAPHHTSVERTATGNESESRLRILFAAEPGRVEEIRGLIDNALAGGPWQLTGSGCARIEPADRPHGRLLLRAARTAPVRKSPAKAESVVPPV